MARIGIDVDGVLRDYPRAVVDAFKKYMPEVVKSEEVTGYNFPNIDLLWEEKAEFIFTSRTKIIYRKARPMPGAIKDFQALKKWARGAGHKLVCVTCNSGDLAVYTREWLDKYRLTFDEYHFLPHEMTSNFKPNKASIPIDFLVDDSPGVYEAWVKAKGDDSRFILFDHPYNREVPARWRVSGLNYVPNIVDEKTIPFPYSHVKKAADRSLFNSFPRDVYDLLSDKQYNALADELIGDLEGADLGDGERPQRKGAHDEAPRTARSCGTVMIERLAYYCCLYHGHFDPADQVYKHHLGRFGKGKPCARGLRDARHIYRDIAPLIKGKGKDHIAEAGKKVDCQGTVLDKAKSLVFGDRGQDYGHPREDFTRTAALWTAAIGGKFEFQPEHVALFMVMLKISREINGHKRDNLVDIAGYAQTCEMVINPEEGQDG